MKEYQKILSSVALILENEKSSFELKLNNICELLQRKISYYDWVGFYFAQPKTKTLHLKVFAGIPTEHTVIPFGKGICGQVAVSNENFVVDDIHTQKNYIACSIDVKSEIVIPLFLKGENIGQIDIDSNTLNAFKEEDINFLEELNKQISNHMLVNKLSINIT